MTGSRMTSSSHSRFNCRCILQCPHNHWPSATSQTRYTGLYNTRTHAHMHTHTHTHTFNGHLSRTTWVSRYLKGKTNLDFTKARDSEWQWHQLGYMQVCTSLQTDNHTSTPPLSFLQVGCPSCRPTNSVKALKATTGLYKHYINHNQTLFTLTFRSLPETFVKRRCTILLPVLATVVM